MFPSAPKVLRLPENPNRRRQLLAKEEEYRARLDDPDRTFYVDSATKLFILHCLNGSEKGQVDTSDVYSALASCQLEVWLVLEARPIVYINACLVINDYCTGRLDRTIDGTGLMTFD